MDCARFRKETLPERSPRRRGRAAYVGLALATIGVGLLVHLGIAPLPPGTRDVLGDALWATMIAWWMGAAVPSASLARRSLIAYAACVGVEVSQLVHRPALDAFRATRFGRLTLGSGFDSRDLLAYALGIAMAALLEAAIVARRRNRRAVV